MKLHGLATGIGSLPYVQADEALEQVFKYVPNIPFWPQLPKRDKREGMSAQYLQHIAPVPQSEEGDVFGTFAYDNVDSRLEKFYEKITQQDIDYFKITRDYALGLYAFKEKIQANPALLKQIEFIKCGITGPFTIGASIKDEDGKAYLYDPIAMQALIEGLAMKALWQIKFLSEFNKKIIMFIDEPYLAGFGSAYTPLTREYVVSGLTELSVKIRAGGVLVGVHCCGNTDWSILTDTKTIDIINFDASAFMDKFVLYASNIGAFLKRGGIICWGIVPTQEFTGQETASQLVDKIKSGIDILVKKGVDRELLYEKMLISPACGLGSLDVPRAEKILKLLAQTSEILQNTPSK